MNTQVEPPSAEPARHTLWTKSRFCLMLYLVSVIGITFIHSSIALALLLSIVLLAAGTKRWRYLRRTVISILAFNLTISVGYALVAFWQGVFVVDYLLLINLRVLLLMYLGFWFIARVSLLDALKGWPLASLLATLAISQIKTFERILTDFRAAFESRNLIRPRWIDRSRHATAQTQTLLDKSFAASSEVTQAMRSRGAFDD